MPRTIRCSSNFLIWFFSRMRYHRSMSDDNETFAKKDIEHILEVIATYAKKWERSDRDFALQCKVLFESLSPEGQTRVRSAWGELDLAKRAPVC